MNWEVKHASQVEVGAKGCLFQPTSPISNSVRFRQYGVLAQMGKVMKMHKLEDMRDLFNHCMSMCHLPPSFSDCKLLIQLSFKSITILDLVDKEN